MTSDLIALTAEIIDIASESRHEQELVAWLEADLATRPWLELTRVGDNLVARTDLGRSRRLILAGHTDTVPANGNEQARVVGDRLYGLGATDMKSGLAVMFEAARTIEAPAVDVTYVFYAREEIEAAASGLGELFDQRPDLLVGDAALLGEPTSAAIEAGCQGTMRLRLVLHGARSHTARPWMGRNAVHRLAGILTALDGYQERCPTLDGCEYREALQAVRIEGGVAANVVPDRVELVLNHRFAPDRSAAEAEAHVRSVVAPWIEPGDELDVVDVAPGAPPDLTHPLLAALRVRNDLAVHAKLGWTDVARFAAHGVPAANFGPGDPTIAHTADEFVEREDLVQVWRAVADLLAHGG
jgi:succinyl-diaminopimelate desuccinylase